MRKDSLWQEERQEYQEWQEWQDRQESLLLVYSCR